MSALEALKAVANGESQSWGTSSSTIRLEWKGGEAYGEEAVLESFRRAPLDLAAGSAISTSGALLWTDGQTALVADLYDERLDRMWRIGPGQAPALEPGVSVPFDIDLMQDRGDVFWRYDDHLWLAPEHAAAIETLAQGIVAPCAEDHRVRVFVLRAFSSEDRFGMLASVFRLSSESTRTASFRVVAALVSPERELLVADDYPAAEWVPRL